MKKNISSNKQPTKKVTKSKRANRKKSTLISGPGIQMLQSSTAESYDVVLKNPLKFDVGKGLTHTEWGPGLRCYGMQELCNIVTDPTTGGNGIFSTGNLTVINPTEAYIAPFWMADRVASFSALYQRYAFRKVKIIYVTRVASTYVGSGVIALNNDSGFLAASTAPFLTYANVQSIDPALVFPYRVATASLEVEYSGTRTWYTGYDVNLVTVGPEDLRQCVQYNMVGKDDILSPGGPINLRGQLYCEYIIDFYTPSLNNIMLGLSPALKPSNLITLMTYITKVLMENKDLSQIKQLEKFYELRHAIDYYLIKTEPEPESLGPVKKPSFHSK